MPPPPFTSLKAGDKVIFWPTIVDPFKEYPSSWAPGAELTFEEEQTSAPRPCHATFADGRKACLFWCDVARPEDVTGDWSMAMIKVYGVSGDFVGEFELTTLAEDLLKKIEMQLGDEDVNYSLAMDGLKLSFAKPLVKQGVQAGATLTLVKEPIACKAGVYEMDFKTYPEDRYSEWKELELLPDKTCILYDVNAGPGRCSDVSTTHKKEMKRGHWSNMAGSKVVLKWDDEASKVFNLDGCAMSKT